jgi:hypothetical protein
MIDFPKVLLASPTSASKDYCFDEWIDNIFSFTYPNFDIVIFDNTSDGGKYAAELNERVSNKYGGRKPNFKCFNSLLIHDAEIRSIYMKLSLSHNDCRDYCLKHNYDYMFHLESDIFPPTDVIERLLFHKKHFIGGLYHIYDGFSRTLLMYNHLELAPNSITSKVCTLDDEIMLVNGGVIKIAQCGLGCVLLSNKLLKKIKFRYENFNECFPDTFFAEDCHKNNIPIYCDTSIVCRHENKFWGILGVDY